MPAVSYNSFILSCLILLFLYNFSVCVLKLSEVVQLKKIFYFYLHQLSYLLSYQYWYEGFSISIRKEKSGIVPSLICDGLQKLIIDFCLAEKPKSKKKKKMMFFFFFFLKLKKLNCIFLFVLFI